MFLARTFSFRCSRCIPIPKAHRSFRTFQEKKPCGLPSLPSWKTSPPPKASSLSLRCSVRAMSDEQSKAQEAAALADSGAPTIFDKIIAKEIPADVVYEDDVCLAFRDISKLAPTHVLVIPKVRGNLTSLSKAEESDKDTLGHCLVVANKVAKQENLGEGYRVVVNVGPNGCQSVYHLHLHVIGGVQLTWPPGVP